MAKVKRNILWSFIGIVVLIVAVVISFIKYKNRQCNDIEVVIAEKDDDSFVDDSEVKRIIYDVIPEIQGYKMEDIDLPRLDSALREQPFIRNVDIYKTIGGLLRIEVHQRKPLLRVINKAGGNYYIDADGTIFPVSERKATNTLVASGEIPNFYNFVQQHTYKVSVADKGKDVLADLFYLALLINGDDFWRDQLQQIYVDGDRDSGYEYELIPMVGKQILKIGSIDEYDRKMYYLKSFYISGIKKTDWNKYCEINVKYKDQIVCRKAD